MTEINYTGEIINHLNKVQKENADLKKQNSALKNKFSTEFEHLKHLVTDIKDCTEGLENSLVHLEQDLRKIY